METIQTVQKLNKLGKLRGTHRERFFHLKTKHRPKDEKENDMNLIEKSQDS